MSQRYDETESAWLLPEFMRADAFDAEMSNIVDEFGADVSAATRAYGVWDSIDALDEATLDALADELNILWYDKAAGVEAKRGVIKNSKRIQAKLGTKGALEEILNIYFAGNAVITEWFDYGGEPNHFMVEAESFSRGDEEAEKFLAVLSGVKRKSAVLDGVIATIGSESTVRASAWAHERRIDEMTVRRN